MLSILYSRAETNSATYSGTSVFQTLLGPSPDYRGVLSSEVPLYRLVTFWTGKSVHNYFKGVHSERFHYVQTFVCFAITKVQLMLFVSALLHRYWSALGITYLAVKTYNVHVHKLRKFSLCFKNSHLALQ